MPVAAPETRPVDDPIVATVVLLLVHVPPPTSVSVVVKPMHTLAAPVIADGAGLTLATNVARHPVLKV